VISGDAQTNRPTKPTSLEATHFACMQGRVWWRCIDYPGALYWNASS